MVEKPDVLRLRLTYRIAVVGIASVVLIFIAALVVYRDSSNPAQVVTAVGSVAGVIGTLAGYVAGQTAGAAGKEAAEERADAAQQLIAGIRQRHPEAFPDEDDAPRIEET